MSATFTKLFSSITESTVWCEPHGTRLTWITMLAMADRHGRIYASIPGLANRARVTLQECEQAINTFLGPDPYSRTPDHDGRRIEPIDGGWRLLNHAKYRDMRDEESRREQNREAKQRQREREKSAEFADSQQSVITEPEKSANSSAQADADADAKLLSDGSLPPAPSAPPGGSFEGHDTPREAPNPIAPYAIALHRAGFRCTALNPDLIAYHCEGGTVEHLTEIAAHDDCAGKPAAYVIRFARRELTAAAKPITGASHAPARKLSASEQTRAAIEQRRARESADAAR